MLLLISIAMQTLSTPRMYAGMNFGPHQQKNGKKSCNVKQIKFKKLIYNRHFTDYDSETSFP